MIEKIQNILLKYSMQAEDITLDTELIADLGLSSFDLVSVVADVQEEFGIEIQDSRLQDFFTVGDIIEYLQQVIM